MPSIVWKGQLTFGLISIPVRLLRAARRERVRMHYVHQEAHEPEEPESGPQLVPEETASEETPAPPPVTRLRQSLVTPTESETVRPSEVLRGYEVAPEQYVVFDRDELKSLRRRTSPNMEIVRAVRLAEIDPVYLETSYYVTPERAGEKPYAILFQSLRETQRVALARVGMHGREHVMIVRPGERGILAHTMFYVDEIRFDSEFRVDTGLVGAKELELAKTFLDAIEAPFAPEEFKDEYREVLQAMIAKKTSAAEITAAVETPERPPVPDILEALKKSIAMARKPPAQETGTVGQKKRQSRKAR